MSRVDLSLGANFQRRHILWMLLILLLALMPFALNDALDKHRISLHNPMKASAKLLQDSQLERGFIIGFPSHEANSEQLNRDHYR